MILTWVTRPFCNHNAPTSYHTSVRVFCHPTEVGASPKRFSEILSRNSLHPIENGSVTESHFFEHGQSMMQNVPQVRCAGLAYPDFHAVMFVAPSHDW